ncbi:MAG: asparagine synthase-related protein, partial [Candidatus Binatia bacterium]
LYERFGEGFAGHLQGSFCAALLDDAKGSLFLASDPVGSHPLYWLRCGRRFVFASELKSVLADPDAPHELDRRAVADYLSFGFPLGTKTLAAGVSLLPPGAILSYRTSDGACDIRRYRRIGDAFRPWEGTRDDYLQAVREAFEGAVGRAVSGTPPLGLSVSGGLDTRAILSVVAKRRASVSTYTLGIRGCADERIAEDLSRIAATKHRFHELDERYLGEFLPNVRRMVSLTDGMYLTHGLTELLALRLLEEADFGILIRGHGGELAKTRLAWPFHTDDRVRAMRDGAELVPYLAKRAAYVSEGVDLRELLTEESFRAVDGTAERSLAESAAEAALSPPDLCSYLYLVELHRRFTVASLELFRNAVEIRTPFTDLAFLEVLFRGRSEWREDTDIHRAIIGANSPALGRVRNSNTGAPATASPLIAAAFDKVNSLLRRLRVPGYRH